MKRCAHCKTGKPTAAFYRSKRSPDGLRQWCKDCDKASAIGWRNQNRDRALASLADWRQRNEAHELAYRKRKYQENPAKHMAKSMEWAAANPERNKANQARDRDNHRESRRIKQLAYAAEHREQENARATEWARKNKGRVLANVRGRAAGEHRATPRWANRFFMGEIYALCALRTTLTGVQHHVDHVVPIRSRYVCGLHCEQNMRVIPAALNRSKSNSEWPDMPEIGNGRVR